MGSKKSVRFNEVVLRQVYRSNSSILGQKHKNQKKAEQKRRKAARRASEGDVPCDSESPFTQSADESEDLDHTNDSGLPSSMEESSSEKGGPKSNKKVEPKKQNSPAADVDVKTQKSLKGKLRSKVSSRFINESQHSDLIFNLDFY